MFFFGYLFENVILLIFYMYSDKFTAFFYILMAYSSWKLEIQYLISDYNIS